MNQLQDELIAENGATKIRLWGVNAANLESGNALMIDMKDLPWLQDLITTNVWGSWGATQRDVFILDVFNIKRDVYNLVIHDLSNPTNYAELKARLKLVAGE